MPATRIDTRYSLPGLPAIEAIDTPQEAEQVNYTKPGESVLAAAFGRENTIGSLLTRQSGLPDDFKRTGFNAWDFMTDEEKLSESFSSSAALADSESELNAIRRQVKIEQRNAQILDDAGAWGVVAGITAGVFDPINLIPVGGAAYKTYKTGGSVLQGAMVTGASALGSATIAETALHATQIERTLTESALNMSGAMLLGGALGGFVGKISNDNLVKAAKEIEDSMNVEPKIAAGQDSIGAARFDDNAQVEGKVARGLLRRLAFDPLSRSITSVLPSVRKLANMLAENPVKMDKHQGTAVESLIKLHDGKYIVANEIHLGLYEQMQKRLGGQTGVGRAINKAGYSRTKFNEMVSTAMRYPSKEALPEVKQAAEAWRRELYDPMKKLAIDNKIFPEDVGVETAEMYLNRSWNIEKLRAPGAQGRFIDTVSNWLKERDAMEIAKAGKLNDELQALNKEIDKLRTKGKRATPEQIARINELEEMKKKGDFIESLDRIDVEYQGIAQDIWARITSTPDGRLPYDYQIGKGSKAHPSPLDKKLKSPFKSRSFLIPDDMVEEFLENDIERLAARLLSQMAPDIEIIARFGDLEMREQFDEIQNEYNDMRLRLEDAGDHKAVKKLDKEYERAEKDLRAMRDRMRGVYGMPADPNSVFVRTGRAIRNLNYMRFMGGVVASSIPDIARTFAAEGFANTFKFGLKPLITNLQGFKVSAAEGKLWGVGSNALFNRAEVLADVADITQGGTALERGLQSAAQQFSNINIMNQWTTAMKQLHAVTMQSSVINTLLKGNGDEFFYNRLDRLGINRDQADAITKQLEKHSEKIDDVYISNAKKWDDPDLYNAWGAAIRKESDRVIIVPGQEKPLTMSTEMGKTIFQFRSFMFAATQRMLIAGIQGQEANYMGGFLMLTSLGMMSTVFKNWDAGRETDMDPLSLVVEGIDRSGSLGILMEINNTLEKATGNNVGIRGLLNISQPSSRFASRSAAEAFLGPTFGAFASTIFRVSGAAGGDYDWTEADTRALRRLLPYQNLTFLRQGFDKMEQPITDFVTQ